MSRWGRIKNFIRGILGILCSLILIMDPQDGYTIVTFIITVNFLIKGIREVIYYFNMGIHMVGGKVILYRGIIITDLGVVTLGIATLPQKYVMLYLVFYYLFFAAIQVYTALEQRRFGAPSWKMKLITGITCLGIAIMCVFNLDSIRMVVSLLCIGYIYSSLNRIVTAFQKTEIIYIQ